LTVDGFEKKAAGGTLINDPQMVGMWFVNYLPVKVPLFYV
jgi:hypothetical protein